MAVDLLVMPLSRYWSGSYITPEMRAAWAKNGTCQIARVDGADETLQENTPIGGEDAYERWAQLRDAIPTYLASLPYDVANEDWPESDPQEPFISSIPHPDYGAYLEIARKTLEPSPSLWQRMIGNYSKASHAANGQVFVRTPFEKAFQKADTVFGSIPVLERELAELTLPAHLGHVRTELEVSIAEAKSRNLPLIIDI